MVKVDRRIRWHYTTTILRLRIGARLTRHRNCKFHNFARTISRHADGISRYSVPPGAGPLLPLVDTDLMKLFAERRRWLCMRVVLQVRVSARRRLSLASCSAPLCSPATRRSCVPVLHRDDSIGLYTRSAAVYPCTGWTREFRHC